MKAASPHSLAPLENTVRTLLAAQHSAVRAAWIDGNDAVLRTPSVLPSWVAAPIH
jgi:hypothetical protein